MKLALPLVHDLDGVPCLVVGAGVRAARKARWLIAAGAQLTVVAPARSETFNAEIDPAAYRYIERAYTPDDLQPGTRLVVCATDNRALNGEIYTQAQGMGVLVNCVDDPDHCNVTFPAIIDRSPLIVSVSTGGVGPAFARVVRGWIEELLPFSLGEVVQRVAGLRPWFKAQFSDLDERTHAYNALLTRPSLQAMATETDDEIKARILAKDSLADVVLVGAGPGDPDLITVKGMRAIQYADVIFYDQLANVALLEYARRDAELVYVGKQGPKPGESPARKNNRSTQQTSINEQIVAAAREGKRVVRLKGGDPFIYGRGGEEVEVITRAGFDVQVIPGITAALGAASYAGIPLTHRDHAQSVRFVTGHRVENAVNLDWPELGKADQTLVIYMGLVGLAQITARLIEFGASPERPVALIERATLPEQRIVTGTLATIAQAAEEAGLDGPTLAIVGDVAAFAGNRLGRT
ncbi:MAG: siroheme synthase CysG [Pseudomonadales bacterium]